MPLEPGFYIYRNQMLVQKQIEEADSKNDKRIAY